MRPKQYLPKVYCLNGLFYIAESNYIMKKNTFFTKKTSPFFVNLEESLNLDLPDDIVMLKIKIKKSRAGDATKHTKEKLKQLKK